ncbi:MAG: hypothetical protein ABI883_06455 [Chthoniobacterales bacterium]
MKKTYLLTLTLCVLGLAIPAPAFAGNKGAKRGAKPDKSERQEKRKLVHEYDKNEDGKIDGAEADALKKAFDANKTGPTKMVDANNDGKLEDSEIAALKMHAGRAKGGAGKKKRKNV